MKKILIAFVFIILLCSCKNKKEDILIIDYNGGIYNNQSNISIVLDGNKTISDIGKPEKHGYDFVGWADNQDIFKKILDENTKLNKKMKLVPIYEAKLISVIFETNFDADIDMNVNASFAKSFSSKCILMDFTYKDDAVITLYAECIENYNKIIIECDTFDKDFVQNYTYISGGKSSVGFSISVDKLSDENTFCLYYEKIEWI